MKLAITSRDRAKVQAVLNEANKGYPKQGVQVGGGMHVPTSMAVTQQAAEIRTHPKTGEMMIIVDASDAPKSLSAGVASAEAKADMHDEDSQKVVRGK